MFFCLSFHGRTQVNSSLHGNRISKKTMSFFVFFLRHANKSDCELVHPPIFFLLWGRGGGPIFIFKGTVQPDWIGLRLVQGSIIGHPLIQPQFMFANFKF